MNKKTRGAISVFLVMILVPCIVVTSVFVDLGRVHMSKAMANSASDLALNSLLSNYDADLEEWYGMVASCQSIEEFYDVSAQFFLRTLSSQGLSDDEIVLLSDYYAHATNNDQIYDLLQVECQTAPSDMISEVSGANLTNATMLKDQIVEFMKYRGPIEITLGLIDRLKNDSSTMNAIESDENKDLVDAKTEYYENEGELLAAAFNTYVAIFDYYSEASRVPLTNTKLLEYVNKMASYRNTYSQIHKLLVTNLYNTDGLTVYNRVRYKLDNYKSTYTKESAEVYSRRSGSQYIIDGEKITSLLDTLETEIENFKTAKNNFVSASSSLMGKLPGSGPADANVIQWWVQMNKAVNATSGTNHTTEIKLATENMLKSYSKVLAIKDCTLGTDIPTDWETRFNELTDKVVSIHRNYIITDEEITALAEEGVTVSIDYTDSYNSTVKKLEDVSSANINKIAASNLYVNVNGENRSLNDAIQLVKTDLSSIKSTLQGYIDLLDIAIDGNEDDDSVSDADKVKSLESLLTLAEDYKTSFLTWENTANPMVTDTQMAEDDRKEIEEKGLEELSEKVNQESVFELKTRLSNIRSQLKSIIDAIDALSYGGNKLVELSDYNSFKTAASGIVSSDEIKLTNQELDTYASSSFSQLFLPNSNFVLAHDSDANYNPHIDPGDGTVQTPGLFVYFHSRFAGSSKQEVDDAKSALDNGKKEGDDAEKNAKDKGRYHGGGSDIVKDFSADGTFNLADGAFSGLLELIKSLINLDISNIRDDLYVSEYIMEMFSYATFEEEGLYSLVSDKKSLKLPSSGYRPTEYNSLIGDASTEKTWLSEKLTDSYNKSLTNKMINKANNVAYGAEVEYILFGGRDGKGNDQNVKDVYSNIYGIRYTLNLVSGFANFWSAGKNPTADAIDAVALLIQAATTGIIPAPVTKVVIIPILTAFETAKDLDRLEAGFPVELYKNTDAEWWIKIPSGTEARGVSDLTSTFKNPGESNNSGNGIFYSDYLTVFVYLGLKSSSASAMYQRMSEIIQTNMRELTGDNGYAMKNARLYFNLKARIRVKPLMITLPYFHEYNNNLDSKTDWCTYEISTTRGYS